MDEFRKQVLKVKGPRKHKIHNSYGVYDSYKYIRKNKWMEIGHPVTEHDFYRVIREVNNNLAYLLSYGVDISLPHHMGRLEVRKYDANIHIKDGKVITNLPIDWDRTLKLWSEDEKAYEERVLVKMEEKEIFKVYYNRGKAIYNNKGFFDFKVNRDLKKKLKYNIKTGCVDAYKLKHD